ncbi:4Fe-4S binding protein [Candidatus Woesearchaeota archaeon]|jgi:ferredoxin|nr:4Fe-4S binding protein [Candidatus Woesearchaeota archaeon]MBT5271718.1 4Fe-4S binding protein [Candidatus Woesearchaeota archaeon]MBT6041093.1 4Fe-4S binding protein [Candidatus Woesearchaeota archaeon]MBT6337418.1 4Fe-4S binding protein [Candidatus Woesearchaeota archaeon]MBT7926922.1 4Fe-4S binding protein [Candidatus Woesearchaeota archaeon]
MKRKIVEIDEDKCNGCGLCIPNCHEGALQIIDNKARLISDLFCDGLGNCLGHCPEGAITIVEREAEPYNERKVMEKIVKQGMNTVKAHLEHMKDHNEHEFLKQALDFLKEKGINNPLEENKMNNDDNKEPGHKPCGCPGMAMKDFSNKDSDNAEDETGKRTSQLRQWPVQLHLVTPHAPYFQGKDVLLAADCTAYALADFHKDYLKDKSLAIACPKLDSEQESYIEKVTALIDQSKINTLTVMIMEVPCCGGLLHIAKTASEKAERKIPIKSVVVGVQGNIQREEWV